MNNWILKMVALSCVIGLDFAFADSVPNRSERTDKPVNAIQKLTLSCETEVVLPCHNHFQTGSIKLEISPNNGGWQSEFTTAFIDATFNIPRQCFGDEAVGTVSGTTVLNHKNGVATVRFDRNQVSDFITRNTSHHGFPNYGIVYTGVENQLFLKFVSDFKNNDFSKLEYLIVSNVYFDDMGNAQVNFHPRHKTLNCKEIIN